MSKSKDPASLKKILKTVDRKLIISNSSKMKHQLNGSKSRQPIPSNCLKKREPSKKHLKKNWSPVTELNALQRKLAI